MTLHEFEQKFNEKSDLIKVTTKYPSEFEVVDENATGKAGTLHVEFGNVSGVVSNCYDVIDAIIFSETTSQESVASFYLCVGMIIDILTGHSCHIRNSIMKRLGFTEKGMGKRRVYSRYGWTYATRLNNGMLIFQIRRP